MEDRIKNGRLVYNMKHFITKKLSYTESALSAAFPQLLFIEITRLLLFFFFNQFMKKRKIISHEMTVTVDYIQQ